ncbi:hypothetical protein BN871_BS_00270 [Paenibacillus sp. P22]|nr:hypothetical protein BN871_BS_00270 [Paenibacillus sp. P22]
MLASALRRNGCHGAFEDFEQRLLHALAGHVAGNGWILGLAGHFIDFVDVDDAALGLLDIVIGGLNKLEKDVLDVLAHIAGFREGSRVGNGERNVEDLGHRLRQKRLAGACRADEHDVALLQLYVFQLVLGIDALVMVVYRYGQRFLRGFLADDVGVQNAADILRLRNILQIELFFVAELFFDDLGAQLDAFIAYINAGTGYQLAYLILGLAAERAFELALFFVEFKHLITPWRKMLQNSGFRNGNNLVDQTVCLGFVRAHEVVAVRIPVDLLVRLSCAVDIDLVQLLLGLENPVRVDLDVRGLASNAAQRLMDHDLAVGKREALALGSCGQQQGPHAGGHAYADRGNIRLDELHCIINTHAGRDRTAGRVDVQVDILLRIVSRKEEQLGDDGIGDVIVDGAAKKDNPVLEETGIDIVRSFTAVCLFDYDRDQIHATNLLSIVEFRYTTILSRSDIPCHFCRQYGDERESSGCVESYVGGNSPIPSAAQSMPKRHS